MVEWGPLAHVDKGFIFFVHVGIQQLETLQTESGSSIQMLTLVHTASFTACVVASASRVLACVLKHKG